MVIAMKKGFWKGIGKVPVLVLAAAVTPAAMAQAPVMQGSAPAAPYGQATVIPSSEGAQNSSQVIQPIVMMNSADPSCAPAGAPACGPACSPAMSCMPSCDCGPNGCTFQWAPDKWVNVGAGVRTSFNSVTEGAPGPNGNYFQVNNTRLYFTGKITQVIGFEVNTDVLESPFASGFNNQIQLLDAIVKFEFNDYVNFWMGRLLPPSDRANLSGPFFINDWDFPFVQNYSQVFEGRDDGIVYWGQAGGGQIQWSAGAFNGTGRQAEIGGAAGAGVPNGIGKPEFAMRVEVNLLDPEPGYYKQGSYYGTKDILAIGFALQTQSDAVGNAAIQQNATCWNVDVLFENKMTDFGSLTIEGAFYHYNSINPTNLSVTDPFVARAGESGFIYAGWLLPQEVGCCGFCGRFRPFIRYQQYNYSNPTAAAAQGDGHEELDGGLEFAIKAQSARLMASFGRENVVGFGWEDIVRVGAQVNF